MIVQELAVELGSDERGFVLEGPVPSRAISPAAPPNTLFEWWPASDSDLSGFLVKTGSQWGPFRVLLRVLDIAPGPPAEQWEDVVEVSVDVSDAVAISEIVQGPVGNLLGAVGEYRMRVAARGRTEAAARDSSLDEEDASADDEAHEHYLVELWPAEPATAEVIREDSQYAKDSKDPPAPDWPAERDPGLSAAWAIVRELRGEPGASQLPGNLDTTMVELELPGTLTRVFNRVRHVFGWPPAQGGTASPDPMATAYHDATLPEFDGIYEQVGHVATTLVELGKPNRIVLRWNWVLDGGGALCSRPRLLSEDSTVTIILERTGGEDGDDPRTRVRLTHEGIPQAWVHHLESLWAWHLVAMASR